MDSGASCLVIHKDHVSPGKIKSAASIKLMNVDGSDLSPIGTVEMKAKLRGALDVTTSQSAGMISNG